MEVLTEVDADRIVALRARDEFFWLDLAHPSDASLDVLGVQRRLASQRDQWGPATEAILDLPGLTHGSRPYLRDIGDHLAQVTGELDRQTDDLGALTSTYFNANANRLNRIGLVIPTIAAAVYFWRRRRDWL
jgi:Mg2+ and Co2+ transporter CorA